MRHIFALFLTSALLLASACHRNRGNDSPENIDNYMASLSAQAVKRAGSSYGVNLDYSPDSVKGVEKILATKYEMQKAHPMAEIEIVEAAHLWGAYIGEVMKRVHPAHWTRDSTAAGKDALPIVFNDSGEESYPCAWVYHRLMNGEEDNIWVKFHFITQPGGLKQYFPPKKGSSRSPQ